MSFETESLSIKKLIDLRSKTTSAPEFDLGQCRAEVLSFVSNCWMSLG